MESSEKDPELVPEAIFEKDGLKVSKSPWGPQDEIGRLNWITPERRGSILEHLSGAHVFDLNVDYFINMPSWIGAGDPTYAASDDAHAAGIRERRRDRRRRRGPRVLLVLRRRDPDVHALRHAHRHAEPRRASREVLERLDARSRISAAASGTRAERRTTRP